MGIGRAEVETFIEKTLRRVGMGIDDQGGVVNGSRSSSDGGPGDRAAIVRKLKM